MSCCTTFFGKTSELVDKNALNCRICGSDSLGRDILTR